MAQGYNEELGQDKPNVTLLVLAMATLAKMWSKEQCRQFGQKVDLLSIRQQLEDIDLSSTKTQLLREYNSFTATIQIPEEK